MLAAICEQASEQAVLGAIVFDWPTMYVISLPEGKGATAAETYEFVR